MSVLVHHPATRAIDAVLAALEDASIAASRDAGAFYPQPVGVLVGLPEMTKRGQYSRVFALPILVVSGDPLNSPDAVDRLYALADDVVLALEVEAYRTGSWRGSPNAEPLPAIELTATIPVTEEV